MRGENAQYCIYFLAYEGFLAPIALAKTRTLFH